MFGYNADHARWFLPYQAPRQPKIQSTWGPLIGLMLNVDNLPADADTIRQNQSAHIGRRDSNNCLLDVLPLPSRSMKHWIHKDRSALPGLVSRDAFFDQYGAVRRQHLRTRMTEYQPKVVVFYFRNQKYRPWWEDIAGASFEQTQTPGLEMVVTSGTVFVLTNHPVSGLSKDYLRQAGEIVNQHVALTGRGPLRPLATRLPL